MQSPFLQSFVIVLATGSAVPVWADKPADAKPFTVAEVAKRTRPSLVVIKAEGRDGRKDRMGTGFAVGPDLIATNLHVIGQGRSFLVETSDNRKLDVLSVEASDRGLDLAIIRVRNEQDQPLNSLTLGDSSTLQDGQPLVAMGNPHGLKNSVVSGVSSGIREIDGREMIQLAMPIEPGNSGGPVLDMFGRVHGVVTMKAVNENLGFAVSGNLLKPLIDQPNPVPYPRWLTIGAINERQWKTLFGAQWQQRAGRIHVRGMGSGFGGRSLCLSQSETPELPFEVAVMVKLDDESGAAGLVFHADGNDRHYGFYPSNGKLRLSRFDGPSVFSWKVMEEIESDHYRTGEWNQLKVRLEKGKLICSVNGHVAITATDKVYGSGHVGLAKFRQTEAEFRRFQVAKQIESDLPSGESLSKLNGLIDGLPSLDQLDPKSLEPIVATTPVAAELIVNRAKELERQAKQLRLMADDVHVKRVVQDLQEVLASADEQLDLLKAGLLIARLDERDVDVEGYLREVDRMVEEIQSRLAKGDGEAKDAGEAKVVAELNRYLFAENGFHGSRFEYYHRANSYLNRVIDDRVGLPITLSVLYMELGRRLGVKIEGVGLPGHFVVRHVPKKGDAQLLDVFEDAKKMSPNEATAIIRNRVRDADPAEFLKASSPREILQRMLRNLLGVAQQKQDREAMLRYLEAILTIDPEDGRHRGMRAVVRFETGRQAAAIADLDWFLETEPEGIELNKIRQMRDYFEQRRTPPR